MGASGDLVPLAHLCLPLVGLGEVEYKGELSGKLSWGNEDGDPLADGEKLSNARQVLLDLQGKKSPTVIKLR